MVLPRNIRVEVWGGLQAKVGMFVSMQQLLQQASSQSLLESSDKLVQLLLEHIGESFPVTSRIGQTQSTTGSYLNTLGASDLEGAAL